MDFAGAFAAAASMVPEVFIAATARWPGTPVQDAGGSITAPGAPTNMPVVVQFDKCSTAMRSADDFLETDVAIIVLTADAPLTTEAVIIVATGERAGTWSLKSTTRDPASVGWECRGRLCR